MFEILGSFSIRGEIDEKSFFPMQIIDRNILYYIDENISFKFILRERLFLDFHKFKFSILQFFFQNLIISRTFNNCNDSL